MGCVASRALRRYRKKVEKDEEYIRQVKALGDVVEHSIMQNIAVDIYQAGAGAGVGGHACTRACERAHARAFAESIAATRTGGTPPVDPRTEPVLHAYRRVRGKDMVPVSSMKLQSQ
eukprot:4543399-Pleurochrysis_carterae.AAC.1